MACIFYWNRSAVTRTGISRVLVTDIDMFSIAGPITKLAK